MCLVAHATYSMLSWVQVRVADIPLVLWGSLTLGFGQTKSTRLHLSWGQLSPRCVVRVLSPPPVLKMRGKCVLKDPHTIHAVLSTISSSKASYRVLSDLRILSLCLQRGATFFWGIWSSQSRMMAIALHLNCTSVPSSGALQLLLI